MAMRVRASWSKIIVVGCALAVVGAGGAYWFHRHHMAQLYRKFKMEGIAASESGQYPLAVANLHYFLTRYQDDQEALRAYVKARPHVEATGERSPMEETIFALRHLIELEPDKIPDLRQLMHLYRDAGADSEAASTADDILATVPNDADALSAKTNILMRSNKWDEALSAALHWVDVLPTDLQGQMTVLGIMRQTHAGGQKLVDRAIKLRESYPGDPRFKVLEGIALTLVNKQADALHPQVGDLKAEGKSATEWFRAAAAHPVPDAAFLRQLVSQFDRLGLFQDSLGLLQQMDRTGACPPIRRDLMRRLLVKDDWAQIISTCEDGKSVVTPADSEVAAIYAIALDRLGRKSASRDVLKTLAAKSEDLLASAWVSILDRPANPSRADLQKIIAACSAALDREPNDAPLQYLCGQHLAQTGNTLAALVKMHDAAVCALDWALPLTTAAELELKRGEVEAAQATANEAYRRAAVNGSKKLTEPVLVARVAFAALIGGHRVDEDKLKLLVDAVQKALPGEETTLQVRVSLLARSGNLDEARTVLQHAIASSDVMSSAALQNLAAISDLYHLQIADACIERAEHEHGVTPELALAHSLSLMNKGDAPGGLRLLQEDAKTGRQEDASLWRIIECTYLERSGDSTAAASWIKLADELPNELSVQRAALASRALATNRDATHRIIQRLRTLVGENSPDWRLARAGWLLDSDKTTSDELHEADALIAAAIKDDPSSGPAHFLEGRLLERQGDRANAVAQFRIASDLEPASPDIALTLVHLLHDASDSAEMRNRLQKVADGPSASIEALCFLGRLQQQGGLLPDAETSYRRALQLRPNLQTVQNDLAIVLLLQGSDRGNDEAERLATAATIADPNEWHFRETLARAQKRRGNVDAAIQSLQQAVELSGNDLRLQVERLEWLLEAGRKDEAVKGVAEVKAAKSDPKDIDPDLRNRLSTIELQLTKPH